MLKKLRPEKGYLGGGLIKVPFSPGTSFSRRCELAVGANRLAAAQLSVIVLNVTVTAVGIGERGVS